MSVMTTEAVRLPLTAGVKLTLMVQPAPAETELPQLLVSAKSLAFVPVIAMLEIVSAVLPVFVNETDDAPLVVPAPWLENVKPVGDSVTVPEAAVPVPLRVVV